LNQTRPATARPKGVRPSETWYNYEYIVEAWNALPEVDRTSDKVRSKLHDQGHLVSYDHVRAVLWATVLSEMIDTDDVRVTARTLKLLLDCSTGTPCEEEISGKDTEYARHVAGPLTGIIGRDAQDLAQILARLVAHYDDVMNQCDEMDELRRHGDDDVAF
jgi:hypothetical protein